MITLLTQLLTLNFAPTSSPPRCRPIPGDASWPPPTAWSALNTSISGHLLSPIPPGAPCHPTHPSYNPAICPSIQAGWLRSPWHTENPVSTINNNWNNDSCLPLPTLPCSGKGYPVFVVDARCVEDVVVGMRFAGRWGVRVVVKGTGHDYLGRWVHRSLIEVW